MKLCHWDLSNRQLWEEKGYDLPKYDREKIIKNTKENPVWIHFGAGNIFRAFQANLAERMLNEGSLETGIIVVEGFDYEIIEKIYRPHDNYSLLVTLKADGTSSKKVIGSIVESCILDSSKENEIDRLNEIFQKDSLQMASFTITEKGYSLVDGTGNLLPMVEKDLENGPQKTESYMGKISSLLYTRYLHEQKPIAMVSMDNCSHNGDKLFHAIYFFAKNWMEKGLVEEGFLEYVTKEEKVSFPWTMIDKITPRPDEEMESLLKQDGLNEITPIITTKKTYIAPFVNAEESEYLVIEDHFPNGRPPLEKAGVLFANKETVDKVEKMKVCTCLNPLHTSLAIFGCLLSYEKISDEMKNPYLKKLVEKIGYEEGLKVVVDPIIINPKEFLDTVLTIRIPNPFLIDTPQRIMTDTSQKLAVRFGETIKAYEKSKNLEVSELQFIPLVFAGWLRYLMAIDDAGNEFTLSEDPLLDTLCPYVQKVKIGQKSNVEEFIRPILQNDLIFGVNLYEVGLAEKVCNFFSEFIEGPFAVEKTLKKYIQVY